MFATESEPWKIASLDDLMTLAASMEQEAIDGYIALEKRMADMGRGDLCTVFQSLVAEEQGHLGKITDWRDGLGLKIPIISVAPPADVFDDEGAGMIAPELLTAYRAFSTAVRNEERAFVFWTYVAAHADLEEIRKAAERMAKEELGHVAKLRRERRKAFHLEREGTAGIQDLKSFEERLAHRLTIMAAGSDANGEKLLRGFAVEATRRAQILGGRPFGTGLRPPIDLLATGDQARPLSEFLLDSYLDHSERTVTGEDAERAREFAGQLISCIRSLRDLLQKERDGGDV